MFVQMLIIKTKKLHTYHVFHLSDFPNTTYTNFTRALPISSELTNAADPLFVRVILANRHWEPVNTIGPLSSEEVIPLPYCIK